MLNIVIIAAFGLIIGRVIRKMTPRLLDMPHQGKVFSLPWVEITALALFAHAAWVGPSISAIVNHLVLITLLLTTASTDMFSKYIPDLVPKVGIGAGIALNTFFPDDMMAFTGSTVLIDTLGLYTLPNPIQGLIISIAGCLAGFLLLMIIRRVFSTIADMEVMGFGDTQLMAMIGTFLGPTLVVISLLPAALAGIVMGLILRWRTGQPHIPFGPALGMGGLLTLYHHRDGLYAIDQFYAGLFRMPRWVTAFVFGALMICLILLLRRLRNKASQYAAEIEEDYKAIDRRMSGKD